MTTKKRSTVVVDGSNLATEGRETPSLQQLQAAVKEFMVEYPGREVVVVVDATFGHRVSAAERAKVKQAELDGDIITPPAGAIGRGDAFILKIAQRAGAAVLSNDSFQEFQVEHPWLFEEGRLIGGKPVRKVGWVFTPRQPVRGPRSRAVKKPAALVDGATSAPSEVPSAPATKAEAARAESGKSEGAKPEATKKRARKATPAPAAAPPRRRKAATPPTPTPVPATDAPKAAEPRAARADTVNAPRSFARFAASHKVGDELEGEVVQFTSHGAMVQIKLGRATKLVCYAPLAGLGSPPPKRARDVLHKGETARFRIVSFDEQRRRAELALAG